MGLVGGLQLTCNIKFRDKIDCILVNSQPMKFVFIMNDNTT